MRIRPICALLVLATACVWFSQSGCTITRTETDNSRLLARQAEREAKMIVEDIASFWLVDKPTRLSKWHYQN